MNKFIFFFSFFISTAFSQKIQQSTLLFKPIFIDSLIGIQSFASAKLGDEVLIIGGRVDGLHRRQPWVSFDSAGHNDQLLVVNFKTKQVWKSHFNHVSSHLFYQLKATNHCAVQVADSMILIGGYGLNESSEHQTFAAGLRFSVLKLMQAVKAKAITDDLFEYFEDERFAVTGGQLQCINNTYYLVGGHRFDGSYNPKNGPSFVQKYTDEVRLFRWSTGKNPAFEQPQTNSQLFHKRDYNLVKLPRKNSDDYLVAFSGVFQQDVNLPHHESVQILGQRIAFVIPQFMQHYAHYDCPEIVFFDSINQLTNVLFLGGIAQFYDSLGILVQDDNVPFVNALSRVEINGTANSWNEYLLPDTLPALMGAAAVFFPSDVAAWKNGVWFTSEKYDQSEIELGIVYGGISSSARNIFWVNEGEESTALAVAYQVLLVPSLKPHFHNQKASLPVMVDFVLNEEKERYTIRYRSTIAEKITVTIFPPKGKKPQQIVQELAANAEVASTYFFPKKPGKYRVRVSFEQHPDWTYEQLLLIE